ncbi:diphosphomevalonate decarboxylase [Gammaproteobacteria bacterium]
MEKIDIVKHILRNTNHGQFVNSAGGCAWAPSNVALCKYWGKRDIELNLPVTSSLSISLGNKGAFTKVKQEGEVDNYIVNGIPISLTSKFAKRLQSFLNLFRPHGTHYSVSVDTNVPIAAGFASSACGFAALVQALNQLYDWQLHKKDLSILARLGSGSACRSLFTGFVEWQQGDAYDGMDSYGVKLEYIWPKLHIGALTISTREKPISSTVAMEHTVNTSPFYSAWPEQVAQDLDAIKLALARKDFVLLGQTAENNAIAMHSLMQSAEPPVIYALPQTVEAMAKVRELRSENIPIFFTQDAGPNLQLLFLAEHESIVLRVFPELDVVLPFAVSRTEQVVLVNEKGIEVGASEKLAAHIQGQLHRAFSVFILRKLEGRIEVLLQQRSSIKYHSANLWSNTCCGHPRPGENIIEAAERRLCEEMGFSAELQEIGQFHYTAKLPNVGLIENELDHVLIGFYECNEFQVNLDEVQNCCWVDIFMLRVDLQENPQKYTVWLPEALDLLLQCL